MHSRLYRNMPVFCADFTGKTDRLVMSYSWARCHRELRSKRVHNVFTFFLHALRFSHYHLTDRLYKFDT